MSRFITFLATVGLVFCTLAAVAQPTFTFLPSNATPALGETVTFEVVVNDFTDIASYQYSINWESTDFNYVGVSNFALPGLSAGNFGTTQTGTGRLSTLWSDPFADVQSLANGDTLFTLTLDVAATMGATSDVVFSGIPTGFEIIEDTGGGLTDVTGQSTFNNVTIEIAGGGNGGGGGGGTEPTFTLVPSNTSPNNGEDVLFHVVVTNFTDIASYQYSLNWESSDFDYVGVSNFALPGLSAGNFGTTQTGTGRLSTLWSDPFASVQSLTDGDTLFTLTLTVANGASTTSDVTFSGVPTGFEIIQQASGGAFVDITDDVVFTNASVDLNGGGSGGGPGCTGFSGFGLIVETDSAATGEQLCLDVSACNFTDLISIQYTIQFNSSLLQFDSIANINLQGLDQGSFGTTNAGNGLLVSSWLDTSAMGITVPNETVIYSVCFTAIGAGGEQDTVQINDALSSIEVTNTTSGGSDIGLEVIDGIAGITGTSASAVTVFASCETGNPGDTVTVSIKVRDFENILGAQYSMAWDENILRFHETEWLGVLPGAPTFNTTSALVDAGKLTFLWTDPMSVGQTLADSVAIYNVKFIVDGNVADVSSVSFTGDPTSIEVTQNNGGAQIVPLARIPGKVEVIGEGQFEVFMKEVTGCTGDTVVVQFGVRNFNELFSMQYDLEWNEAELDFIGFSGFNLNGLNAGNFNNSPSNLMRISWVEPLVNAITIADSTYIYEMQFEILGADGTTSTITFLDNPPTNPVEIAGPSGVVPYVLTDGVVNVNCSMLSPLVVSDTTITNVACFGDTNGAIDITVNGGTGMYTYAWNPTAATEDLSNISVGTYTVTISDGMTSIVETYLVGGPAAALSATVTAGNVSCNGDSNGTLTANPAGGTSPYTYAWSNGLGTNPMVSNVGVGTYTVTITDANMCITTAMSTVGQPAPLTATASSTNVSCNGLSDGSVSVAASGGTTAYTYVWSGGIGTGQMISGVAAGTYTVTVTDANMCSTTATTTVSQPAVLTATATASNISCNGFNDGQVSVSVSGGNPGYTYTWNVAGNGPTITGLAPGTYTVTVEDTNNCTTTASATVTQPTALTINATVTAESGLNTEDGAIDITVSGGTPNYTYNWGTQGVNEDLSSLPPGTYTVTATDANGCVISASYTVNAFDAPIITVDNTTNVSCNGGNNGAINISVTGGMPNYTYSWAGPNNPPATQDISGLVSGIYTVTVTDNNSIEAVETITITEPSAIGITLDNTTEVTCNGSADGSISISVNGGTAGYTYAWTGGGSTEDLTGLSGGTYTPTITDANGCQQVGNAITILEPNPITINVVSTTDPECNGAATGAIDISVSGGTPGYTYAWTGGAVSQDLSGITAGAYIVTVTDSRGCTEVTNVINIVESSSIVITSNVTNVSCNGLSDGTITLNVSGGTPNYVYNWDNGLPSQQNQTGLVAGTYNVTVTDANGCSQIDGPITITEPSAIVVTHNVINASDANNDGAVDITVSGGMSPYTYLWSNNAVTQDINNLASGCYTVTVTDSNDCEQLDTAKVEGVMVIMGDVTDVSCFGNNDGAIDITVAGGIEPYVYTWASPINPTNVEDPSPLFAGTYSVTVIDATGTIATETFVVGSPEALTITSAEITNETGDGCNGAINITVIGGTLPYTYQWSNGPNSQDVTDLCKGTYSVMVIDGNGCVILSPEYTIAPPPLIIADATTSNVSCVGSTDGEACVEILGGCGPYTFALLGQQSIINSTGMACFSNLPAGNYSITITDSGTPQMGILHSVMINEPDPIAISIVEIDNNTDPDCNNPNGAINISAIGGTGMLDYLWSNGEESQDIDNLCHEQSPYSVTVTDDNGCSAVFDNIMVPLGLNIQFAVINETCAGDCDGAIDLTVIGGQMPYTYAWSSGPATPDISNLCPNTYNVTVTDANGLTASQNGISVEGPSGAIVITTVSTTTPIGNDNNGAIDIAVTGGWNLYTYSWTGPNGFQAATQDISNLFGGTYILEVTDSEGCIVSMNFDLDNIEMSLSFDLVSPACSGDENGEIECIVNGGSGDYTYEWSDGQAGPNAVALGAGTYAVTVTDNTVIGLSAEASVVLIGPNPLEVDVVITASTGGADGSLEAVVTGGTPDYTYIWNTGASTALVNELRPGAYGLQVIDASDCEVFVSQLTVPVEGQGECLGVKEVFSPNDDGRNDEFFINCISDYNNTLQVFNRWGQLVYEATNYDNTWNGVDQKGNFLPEGGYFYVLEYEDNSETIQVKGAVTIVR